MYLTKPILESYLVITATRDWQFIAYVSINTRTYAIPYIMQKLEWLLFWVFTIWYQLILPVKDNIACKVIGDNLGCWLTIHDDQLPLQERGTYFIAIVIQRFSKAVVLMNQRWHKRGCRWGERNRNMIVDYHLETFDHWIRLTQIAKFMGPTWGPPGSCRPQVGPMLAPWILLSGGTFGYLYDIDNGNMIFYTR